MHLEKSWLCSEVAEWNPERKLAGKCISICCRVLDTAFQSLMIRQIWGHEVSHSFVMSFVKLNNGIILFHIGK